MTEFVELHEQSLPEGRALSAQVVRLTEAIGDALYERGVVRTPLEDISDFAPDGVTILSKNEGLQSTGSFKLRGATAALYLASQAAEARGEQITHLTTASDGNHGHGVRAAAAFMNLSCGVEMAATISAERQQSLRKTGAEVAAVHSTFEAANRAAKDKALQPGRLYVAPFDAVETMVGPAGMAFEIAEDLLASQERGELDLHHDEVNVVVAVAGGGMAASFASVFQELKRRGCFGDNLRLVGAQLERSDAMARELRGEEPLTEQTLDLTCESTALLEVGQKTKAILKAAECFEGIITLNRSEVGEAMLCLQGPYGQTEPAGALSLACALKLARERSAPLLDGKRRVFVTVRCGSDLVTPETFKLYTDEVDSAVTQRVAAQQETRRTREIQEQIAAFRALSARALEGSGGEYSGQQSDHDPESQGEYQDVFAVTWRAGAVACWSGATHGFAQGQFCGRRSSAPKGAKSK